MKINNGPVLCPHCGCLSAYYEIDRLAAIREKVNKEGGSAAWDSTLQAHKKKAFTSNVRVFFFRKKGLLPDVP
ncbi:hypothetical protein SeGA_3503 [Salmonella enterica subsp. enterica serovar Gaminara str. A4-567]|nr:hypothetical protein SeGA_3503 [Salmonella enterica subsp. enterica serovar Gaminara str. A4-567]